jgi:O-methyltransferase
VKSRQISGGDKRKRFLQRRVVSLLWRWAPGLMFRLRDLRRCKALTGDTKFLQLYRTLYREGRVRMTIRELYNLYELASRATKVQDGDFAEFGVYKGGSARVLCEVKGDRSLWLFDTFQGMPASDPSIDEFGPGDFDDTSLEGVREYLKAYNHVEYISGFFPASASSSGAINRRYAFVNLDVDLYRSTYDGLAFFYPRMVPGGVLISHDYFGIAAVTQAFEDFFRDKKEPVLHLFDTQGLVIKL